MDKGINYLALPGSRSNRMKITEIDCFAMLAYENHRMTFETPSLRSRLRREKQSVAIKLKPGKHSHIFRQITSSCRPRNDVRAEKQSICASNIYFGSPNQI